MTITAKCRVTAIGDVDPEAETEAQDACSTEPSARVACALFAPARVGTPTSASESFLRDYRAVGYFEKGASPCDVFSRAQRTAPLKQVNFRVCT
jgi:hypothetical protein